MESIVNITATLTPIITIIISSVISFFIAKHQTKSEIKKLIMSYNREDKQCLNDAYAELMVKTKEHCDIMCRDSLYAAILANSKLLAVAPKQFQPLLMKMDEALQDNDITKIQTLRKSLMGLLSDNA